MNTAEMLGKDQLQKTKVTVGTISCFNHWRLTYSSKVSKENVFNFTVKDDIHGLI